jgi:WD40 repeat protein
MLSGWGLTGRVHGLRAHAAVRACGTHAPHVRMQTAPEPRATNARAPPASPRPSPSNQVLEHKCPVTRVAFSPDGSKLLTVGDAHAAWVWDTATGRCLCALAEHKQQVRAPPRSRGRAPLCARRP